MYSPGMAQHHQARRQSHCVPTRSLQRPGQVGHGGRNQAHRNLLRGNACTYDTRCCGKGCVYSVGFMDDRAMSACGDQSSGPGFPLPALASIALALILDGLHLELIPPETGPANEHWEILGNSNICTETFGGKTFEH